MRYFLLFMMSVLTSEVFGQLSQYPCTMFPSLLCPATFNVKDLSLNGKVSYLGEYKKGIFITGDEGLATYNFDESGKLTGTTDYIAEVVYKYAENAYGYPVSVMTKFEEGGSQQHTFSSTKPGVLEEKIENVAGRKSVYEFDAQLRLIAKKIYHNNSIDTTIGYKRNGAGRISEIIFTSRDRSVREYFTYDSTGKVSSIKTIIKGAENKTLVRNFDYGDFDSNGNWTIAYVEVTDSGRPDEKPVTYSIDREIEYYE